MNRKDLVPIIPPEIAGFKHSSGEIHVEDDGSFFACPGQDNDNSLCSTGDASNIFEASVEDHFGAQLSDFRARLLMKYTPVGPYGDIELDSHCRP